MKEREGMGEESRRHGRRGGGGERERALQGEKMGVG